LRHKNVERYFSSGSNIEEIGHESGLLVIITPAAARIYPLYARTSAWRLIISQAEAKSTQNRNQIFSNSFRFHQVLMVLIRIDDVG
jgi:hypothetical protein